MAFVHGKKVKVLVGEFDITGHYNSCTVTFARQTVNTTVFGDDDDTSIAGIGSGSLSLGGLWDNTDLTGSDFLLDAARDGSQEVLSVSPQGLSAIGQRAVLMNVRQTGYPWRAPNNDAIRLNAAKEADGGIRGGVVWHQLTEETGVGDFTSVGVPESTAFGSVAHVHVTAFSGTDAIIKVTDSTDNSIFADHITFTTVTGVTSQRSSVAGLVNKWARVELTGTFSAITFAVTFARNLQ